MEGAQNVGAPGIPEVFRALETLSNSMRIVQKIQALQGQQLILQGQALEAQGQAIQAVQSGLSLLSQVSPPILQSSPADASTDIGPSHCVSKVVELPAKLVFSGKREELQRWLKDVEDFFESKKMKMAKGRLPAYLKEWYEKYEEEYGVFSNWESLKTELTERLKVTMERSIAQAKLQALRCTEALGVEKYNEAFSQLVGQLPHLWEEDVVEDYIKGLPNSIALDVVKAKTHTLLEIQKEAAKIEAFLSSRAKDAQGHRARQIRATPVQSLTRGDGSKEEKGSGHAVVIPSRVPPSRRSGGGDTETRAIGAEGMVVVESVKVAVTVDDLESGRSTGAMKREKCPRHMVNVVVPPSECVGESQGFQGSGSECSSGLCAALRVGACCDPATGACSQVIEGDCNAAGRNFAGVGISCAEASCPQPKGACCDSETGHCEQTTMGTCTNRMGSAWYGVGVPCEEHVCKKPSGACCFDDSTCSLVDVKMCIATGGKFQGPDTNCTDPRATCTPPLLTGACCLTSGVCAVTTNELCQGDECIAQGGEPLGANSNCLNSECTPAGACCFPDETCSLESAESCTGDGGIFQGDDTTCDGVNCDILPPSVACCLPSGDCIDVSERACTESGGSSSGTGSRCSGKFVRCPKPGACCVGDGECLYVVQEECEDQSGSFKGDKTRCAPGTCAFASKDGGGGLFGGSFFDGGFKLDGLKLDGLKFDGFFKGLDGLNFGKGEDLEGQGVVGEDGGLFKVPAEGIGQFDLKGFKLPDGLKDLPGSDGLDLKFKDPNLDFGKMGGDGMEKMMPGEGGKIFEGGDQMKEMLDLNFGGLKF
uniref:Retrotransposon gag domain-containing protein n=1 Tax=Chromera velia CCMP2878 TaxID=1169474 RepID=A0A0G4FBU1_9ALVE|eukprot:Cvel_16244.t1-p1 / transcript=Cvel_16244.t1 / gene=Cvel_16244 / organism=Chromera_velia_CCMP2878 / gene_product=Keratin-associated protein 5-1, putative / transcript_product=Keratin-associated protein 5-1, putative / location=Cvel_scaffold1242:37194-47939(-) / protein_length=821 / sequence_SO=supercontig / SO=protein_coding / is_pseudo=false